LTESVPAEAAAAEPTAIVPPPLNRGPSTPGAAEPRRAESSVAKPLLPVFLPAQQKMFSPSEVAYCPICFSAFSSRGPALGVRCPHCAASVNLVSRQDYMVHRCGKCGRLHRTTHFPPAIGPYFFRYYCSFCRENRWFPN
jgi:phage FluMu protein Com